MDPFQNFQNVVRRNVYIPKDAIGSISGGEGQNIKQFGRRYACDVKIVPKEELENGLTFLEITSIKGSIFDVLAALNEVEEIVS
jgi:hypothetical protein